LFFSHFQLSPTTTAAAGRTSYAFDSNWNQQIVQAPSGARTTTTWNYENQPTLFRMPDGSRVTMTYNANNRRVDKE
jgi:YD repeat-containing protein